MRGWECEAGGEPCVLAVLTQETAYACHTCCLEAFFPASKGYLLVISFGR